MDQSPIPASHSARSARPVRCTVCPSALHLWFNVRARLLDARTTAGANEVYTAPRNAERIGFILASGGAAISYRPTQFGPNVVTEIYTPAGANAVKPITIAQYGQLILEPWDFVLTALGNTYAVWELFTPATLKNEIIG